MQILNPWMVKLLAALAVLVIHWRSSAAEIESVRQLWMQKNFSEAFDGALLVRNQYFGRTIEIDYIIGTSACRLGRTRVGLAYLTSALSAAGKSPAAVRSISTAIGDCGPVLQTEDLLIASLAQVMNPVQVGAQGSFKTYWAMPDSAVINSLLPEQIVPIKAEVLAARRRPIGDSTEAVKTALELAGSNVIARAYGKYILVGQSEKVRKEVAELLQTYERFFNKSFGLDLPNYYVTVYLLSAEKLPLFAASAHGLKLPSRAIGYSHQDDLSIASVHNLPNNGSLCHELFHLMARSSFGDIPGWLDEGMASVYEESKVETDGSITGLHNWRLQVLYPSRQNLPSIAKILGQSRAEFYTANPEKAALNESLARYFLLFLQRNDLLSEVFNAFRESTPENFPVIDPANALKALQIHAEDLLVKSTGRPVAKLDDEFHGWLDSLFQAKVQEHLQEAGFSEKSSETLRKQ
jgi:hypothetical protein